MLYTSIKENHPEAITSDMSKNTYNKLLYLFVLYLNTIVDL